MKIYLAGKYSDKDHGVRQMRHDRLLYVAADLMQQGHIVFSPIAHSHNIALVGNLPKGFDFWETQDRSFIEWCEAVVVADFPGWEESAGVKKELEIARELGKKILYYSNTEE